jgi:ATP-dependent exoDNAse (exonuclease V) alpha subunit
MPASGERVLFSTPEQLAIEQQLVEHVVASRRTDVALVDSDLVRRAMSARPTLTPDQRELVRGACLDGDLVFVLAGIAGSGKTYALAAAREAWQASGRPVVGVAVARRAAAGLRDGAGIESTTVAALLQDARRGVPSLPDGAVLVVDEAGMVPTRDLAVLLEEVERAHGKLVLVGDHHQLPELEAGGVFRGLVQRGLATELRDNVRQVHHWEREALDELRDGRTAEALERYVAKERIRVAPDEEAARRALVRDWPATPGEAVMIAHRRAAQQPVARHP